VATELNYLISQTLLHDTDEETKTNSEVKIDKATAKIIKDLNSEKAFERALGLHRLMIQVRAGTQRDLTAVYGMLERFIDDEELFVFEHAQRCYLILAGCDRPQTFAVLQAHYHTASTEETKLRVMEILHSIIRALNSFFNPMEVFPFLEGERSCMVLGAAVKKLGSAIHPWAGGIRYQILQSIKLANSRLTAG
jgi:hypothetical protein